MRSPRDASERAEATRRYVTAGRRYARLDGNVIGMAGDQRAEFLGALAEDAGRIASAELEELLGAGWRERRTAAWLVAVSRRTGFRGRIGELLLAGEGTRAGRGYCVALASFGTPADADVLIAYLDRYLLRSDLYGDQVPALGALMHLDAGLGTDHAARFLSPGGLWHRWCADLRLPQVPDPVQSQEFLAQLCGFAADAAALVPARGRQADTP